MTKKHAENMMNTCSSRLVIQSHAEIRKKPSTSIRPCFLEFKRIIIVALTHIDTVTPVFRVVSPTEPSHAVGDEGLHRTGDATTVRRRRPVDGSFPGRFRVVGCTACTRSTTSGEKIRLKHLELVNLRAFGEVSVIFPLVPGHEIQASFNTLAS